MQFGKKFRAMVCGRIALAVGDLIAVTNAVFWLLTFTLDCVEMKPNEFCRKFLVEAAGPSAHGLDIGCGDGSLIKDIQLTGADCVGVEIDSKMVAALVNQGLNVQVAFAESLPFENASMDFVVSSVVLPYTDPKATFIECARILKTGANLRLTTHSIHYGLGYLLVEKSFWRRVYGLRMLVNTFWFQILGIKLPGFLGDTLCFSEAMLVSYARQSGFENIVLTRAGDSELGRRFICLHAERLK